MSNRVDIPFLVQKNNQNDITNIFVDPHSVVCQRRFGFFGKYTPVVNLDDETHKYTCEVLSASIEDILMFKTKYNSIL